MSTREQLIKARLGMLALAEVLYDFVGYRTQSIRVIGALVDNLPMGVILDRARIRRVSG
jgi:hypothetical protein